MSIPSPYQIQIEAGYTIHQLVAKYGTFITPALQHDLLQLPADERGLAVIATDHHQPVGVALVQFQPDHQGALLLSLTTLPGHQNHGLATKLITRLEHILKVKGYRYLDWMHVANWPDPGSMKNLSAQNDWHLWYDESKSTQETRLIPDSSISTPNNNSASANQITAPIMLHHTNTHKSSFLYRYFIPTE